MAKQVLAVLDQNGIKAVITKTALGFSVTPDLEDLSGLYAVSRDYCYSTVRGRTQAIALAMGIVKGAEMALLFDARKAEKAEEDSIRMID